MANSTKSTIILPMSMCVLLNVPDSRMDCSTFQNKTNCIFCPVIGKFLTEGGTSEDSLGLISRLLVTLTVIIGMFAVFMSIGIINILKRQSSGRSFDILLHVLAILDLIASIFAMMASISMIIFLDNLSRNYVTLLGYLIGLLVYLFAKSGSAFMTVAISVERFMAIVFPFQKRKFFTPKRTYILAFCVCLLSGILATSRCAAIYISKNLVGEGIASIEDLEYLIYPTKFGVYLAKDLKFLPDQIDFWLPLLLLTGFTLATYYRMRKYSAGRSAAFNLALKKDKNPGEMLMPVVIVFFVSNIVLIMASFHIFLYRIAYREGFLGGFLVCVINSSANLPIYYLKSPSFRKEAKVMVTSWLENISWGKNHIENSLNVSKSEDTKSTQEEDSSL